MTVELHQTAFDYFINILTAVFGPLIVGLVIWRLGQTNEEKRVKTEAIRELMTYRGDYASPEFRRALNKVSITFHEDASIRKQIRELYETINNPSSLDESINRKIVGVIYSLCQKNSYKQITEYDIDQSFLEASQTPAGDLEDTVEVPRQYDSPSTSTPTANGEKRNGNGHKTKKQTEKEATVVSAVPDAAK